MYTVRVYTEKLIRYVRWSRFSFACYNVEWYIQWRIYYLLWLIEILLLMLNGKMAE